MKFIRNLKIWQKLVVTFVLMLIPMAALIYMVISAAEETIAFTEKERSGVKYVVPVRQLSSYMAQHRGMSNAFLNGDNSFKAKLERVEADIEKNIKEIDAVDAQLGVTLKTTSKWDAIKQKWSSLKDEYLTLKAKDSFAKHTAIVEDILALSNHAADTSNLILDPYLDSYYMMDLIISRLPYLIEEIGKTRGSGSGILARGTITEGEVFQMAVKISKVEEYYKAADKGINVAYDQNAAIKPKIQEQEKEFLKAVKSFIDQSNDYFLSKKPITAKPADYFASGSAAIKASEKLYEQAAKTLDELLVGYIDKHTAKERWTVGLVALFLSIALIVTFWVVRNIMTGIATAVTVSGAIANDDLSSEFSISSKDEVGKLLTSFSEMQANLKARTQKERGLMNDAMRVQSALAAVTSNVMVADKNYNIVFMNESLNKMFKTAQDDIRKDLPNFNYEKLMGSCMDQFHKNPAHQQRMLAELKDSVTAQIEVGGRTFKLVATPVFNENGERLGTAVEWHDRTAELQIEREVESVVQAAAEGNLDKRLPLEGKTGFTLNVSQGINQFAEVCSDVVAETIRVFGAMSNGDLTKKIDRDYKGSFGQLKDDVNATVDKLVEVVNEIQTTAVSVNTGASEISIGNQSLSQRNEEQASSLEETASSMEEMTSTVRQNADNADQANQLATAARNQAEKGGAVVNNAVAAMGEINASSKKVADIISVIDEIAFQTNLLALNAAVEAARAGEQGRGFAVVASEVRNLAQRSAGAAKEIKDLIEESVSKVEEGSQLVNASGETLEEIVNGIKKVSDIVAEIAAASAEQASGIDQVNKAVTQLDDMTQQNAALVEEAAAASEAMQGQAESLTELMTFFTTGQEHVVAAASKHAASKQTAAKPKPKPVAAPAARGSTARKPVVDDEDWEEF